MYVYNARTFDIIENANYEDYIGDANYIVTDKLLCNPIIDPKTTEAREATREELCELGRLNILDVGEVYQDGKITYKAPPEDMLKPKWVYPDWIEQTTEDEISLNQIQTMYNEYSSMDMPSVVKEMESQDPAIAEEFLTMLIELRTMASQISEGMGVLSVLPEPSKELIAFKNKFKGMIL